MSPTEPGPRALTPPLRVLQPRHDVPGAHGLGGEGLPAEAPRGPHREREVMRAGRSRDAGCHSLVSLHLKHVPGI